MFDRIDADELGTRFAEITEGSVEDRAGSAPGAGAAGESSGAMAGPADGEALATYATNMTERAKDGKIDPIVGRDDETRQMVDILMRRRQNNPILVGEAGVGKTAVVEGFALGWHGRRAAHAEGCRTLVAGHRAVAGGRVHER